MPQTDFNFVFGRSERRIARHLRPGTSRRRNRDHWQRTRLQWLPCADHFQIIQNRLPIRRQRGDRFARIDHAPAAHRNYQFTFRQPQLRHPFRDQFQSRFVRDTERRHSNSARRQHPPDRLRPFRFFTSHNQRARPMTARNFRQQLDLAGAENNAIGRREFEVHHHAPSTSLYFTPTRGSAIIGATASRHVL
jgi:hypothetical protein